MPRSVRSGAPWSTWTSPATTCTGAPARSTFPAVRSLGGWVDKGSFGRIPRGAGVALESAWARYDRARADGAGHKTDVAVSALRVHIASAGPHPAHTETRHPLP